MNILLADDDSNIHAVMRLWLGRYGHQTESAFNGQEALAKLQAANFDALITDVNMPLINGIELVKAALDLPAPPQRIVILTSRCDIGALRRQMNDPKVQVLSKPFNPTELIQLVENSDPQPNRS